MTTDITPLYQNLKSDLPHDDISQSDKEYLNTKIKELDKGGMEILYILIRMYELETTKSMADLPYGAKLLPKAELKIALDSFPNQLKQLVYKFVQLHIEKTNVDNEISHNRKAMGVKK